MKRAERRELFFGAADRLQVALGRRPSHAEVHAEVGGSYQYTTVFMKEWESIERERSEAQAAVPPEFRHVFERAMEDAWPVLRRRADAAFLILQKEHAEALAAADDHVDAAEEECSGLRDMIAALRAELEATSKAHQELLLECERHKALLAASDQLVRRLEGDLDIARKDIDSARQVERQALAAAHALTEEIRALGNSSRKG